MSSNLILNITEIIIFMKRFFNRPLAPHLTVYTPQLTSLLSIWHRVSILLVLSFYFLGIFLLTFLVINFKLFNFYYFILNHLIILYLIFIFISTNLVYHILSGVRHIIWDLSFFLSIKNIYKSGKFIIAIIIFFQILTII